MSKSEIGGHLIELKNLDKPFFPDVGITKGDVVDYYREMAEVMLPYLEERPLSLQRFPDGIGEEGFFQQNRPDYFPEWIAYIALERAGEGEGPVQHVICRDTATLVYLANQAVLTLHGWLSLANRPNHPDQMIFDLDPPDDDFDAVRYSARQVGELMEAIGLTPHLMTTGSRGLHVRAPLDANSDFDAVRALASAMADHLAKEHPERLTVEQRKDEREGRLYLDVMRNAYGQTAVVPYAVRAKRGAPVATPLDWDELDRSDLSPQRYDWQSVRQRLAQKDDPWRAMRRHAASAKLARERFEKLVGG